MPRSLDADLGAGAAWHRAHRVLVGVSAGGFVVCIALAVWLGQVSGVDDTPGSSGRAAAVRTLMWKIPAVAVLKEPASSFAVDLARVYLAIAALTITTAAFAGLAWLRADRVRKPLGRSKSPRHVG
jgi:energy-converting hydrogenase Eha subunit B